MNIENKNIGNEGQAITEPLTTGEVAEYCHVTYRAVLKWIAEGKLKAYRTPGQHSRIEVNDFLEFLKTYKMPIPPQISQATRKQRILIVDDDKKVVELMKTMLKAENRYDIDEANDGFTAGRKFSDNQPDLVLLDINMPGLNGFEVCANIRLYPQNKGVKILVVSGFNADDVASQVKKAGGDDFLPKPFSMNELKKKIGQLLDKPSITAGAAAIVKKLTRSMGIVTLGLMLLLFTVPVQAQNIGNFVTHTIKQEIVKKDGVLVSGPDNTDEGISNMLYMNNIRSLEDYAKWLENNIKYLGDHDLDVWSNPLETIQKKAGDCEDFTLLTMRVLKVLGYEPRFLAAVGKNRGHAICVLKVDGYFVIFDNFKLVKTEAQTEMEFAQHVTSNGNYNKLLEYNETKKDWNTLYKKS